jgi:hypothetical protein
MTQECEKCKEKQDMLRFLEDVSLILGKTHGGISQLLGYKDEELREKLLNLFHNMSEDIQKLYYSATKPN